MVQKRVRNINSRFTRLYPGDSIFIPKKENYEPFDITNFINDYFNSSKCGSNHCNH